MLGIFRYDLIFLLKKFLKVKLNFLNVKCEKIVGRKKRREGRESYHENARHFSIKYLGDVNMISHRRPIKESRILFSTKKKQEDHVW